jgi:hypothetical protein
MGQGIANATQLGWANQTPAAQATARMASGARSAPRRRKVKARRKSARRTTARAAAPRRRRRTSVKQRLVKGSAAAKRYMAKIRKLRKR